MCGELDGRRSAERAGRNTPEEDADVRDVVPSAPGVDMAYIQRMRLRFERRAEQGKRVAVADICPGQVSEPDMLHILGGGQQLEKLDGAGVPAGDIVGQLLQHGDRALASPI